MHDRGERGRGRSYDSGGGRGVERAAETKRSPEEEATDRVYRVWQEVESAASRAEKLSAIVRRDEWRAAHDGLEKTHNGLVEALKARAVDAKVSARAQEHYANATAKLSGIATVLRTAPEPRRSVPSVAGEEAIEASINDRSAAPDHVLAWVAELDLGERTALAARVESLGGGAVDRRDGFAIALANYFGDPRVRSQCADLRSKFLKIAKNPRRTASEIARARARANAPANPPTDGPDDEGTPATVPTRGTGGDALLGSAAAEATVTSPPGAPTHAPGPGGGATGSNLRSRTLLQALSSAPVDDAAGDASPPNVSGGKRGPLPYQGAMERSFDRSFANVEAHTGVAAALDPLGAQALTVGRTVAFADAQPSPALVAHEATHVAQNDQAGSAVAMASGLVAPRESAAEAEADANASLVAAHGPGVRLPPVAAAPAAHVQLAPKRLVPDADAPPRKSTIVIPDADHPSRRDIDGDQVIQTGKTTAPGKPTPPRGKSWPSLAEVTESVHVQVDSGDTLHIDITYRLENRPAEVGEVPDLWIHTERKALLTLGSGEHAGATIIGQARIRLAPDEARDPKAAIAKPSIGADHRATIYLAEAKQYVNLYGSGGRPSLLADAAGNDVLAYDDPLRTLVGLKNILKQQHVAGHGGDVAKMHTRAQRLLAVARRGRAVLEQEIASIASHHDPQPGRVAPVRFLVGDIGEWLAANHGAGRDDTEDGRQLRKVRAELEHLIADVEKAHPPRRDQLDDALSAPFRLVERIAEGLEEVGAMAVDAVVLGVDSIGKATGLGTFDYHPISKLGKSTQATGANTMTTLVTMVNGFADQWSDAIERAKHGDYRTLTDASIDTLMMIDGARTGGVIALENAEVLAVKVGNVATSAHAIVSRLPAEVADMAAAMADGADAFVARLRAGGMQMATEGGGRGPGPNLGGLSAETLAEAAQAAKEAFKDKRLAQDAAKGKSEQPPPPPAPEQTDAAKPVSSGHAPHADVSTAAKKKRQPSSEGKARVDGELSRELTAPAIEKLSKQLKAYEIEDLVRSVGAEEAVRIADSLEGPALRDFYSKVALGRMREEAAEIRKVLFPGKGVGRKNIAVAEAHLDDGARMSTSSTSGPQGKAPKPKPVSQGGQFEPTKDPVSGRVMDTDPEYKTLSQLGEWLEKQYPNGAVPAGVVYLYTEMEMCASCAGIKAQFESKFPGISVIVLADHPYPFPK